MIVEIADILNMLADGIDPTTGEVFDISAFGQEDVLAAFARLKDTVKKSAKKGKYKKLCEKYPKHIVLVKSGYFFSAYFESAEVLGQIMNYKIGYTNEGRTPVTGGPDLCIIAERLHAANLSYIAFNHGEVEDRFDGRNPFV